MPDITSCCITGSVKMKRMIDKDGVPEAPWFDDFTVMCFSCSGPSETPGTSESDAGNTVITV